MHLSAVVRKEGKWFVAWCPELDVASQGTTRRTSLNNLREAIELYLEDEEAPRPSGKPFITTIEVTAAKAPHPFGA